MEVRVAAAGEIPEGGVKIVQAGSLFLGVYLIDGEYYAIEDRCSHDDGPLCEGDRDGFRIECPRHGALFDLRSGAVLSLPATVGVDVYPVVERGGEIFVQT